jgi:hypothetical protein
MSLEHWNTKTNKSLKRYNLLSIEFLAANYIAKNEYLGNG